MSGIAVGLKKGFIVSKLEKEKRPADRKGKLGERTKLIRSIIRDISGYAPYEKRCMELLKTGSQKRAMKFCKRRLGTHLRAKRKREEMTNALMHIREQQKEKHHHHE